jgi:cytochrome d ubiquinol oxidase subunit I
VAVIAGWVTTEVGRQPYTVYGQLLTAQSHSPLAGPAVAASLQAFVLVYFSVFGAGIAYLLSMMAREPATGGAEPPPPMGPQHAAGITPAPALDHAVERKSP